MSVDNVSKALGAVEPSMSLAVDGASLRVFRFEGHERISELYEFTVEVVGADLDIETTLGAPAVLTIAVLDEPRHVHGVVSSTEYMGHSRNQDLYRLTISPWAHRLLHRASCRIFQGKSTPEIVREVLLAAGLSTAGFRFVLTESYAPRDYCVQYRETDLGFISRLLEEDGIFYFFEHHEDRHVWVMADHAQAHASIAGEGAVLFQPPEGSLVQERECVRSFRFGGHVRPGKVVLRDHNLHRPEQRMEVAEAARAARDLEIYDAPAEYQDPGRGGPHQGQTMARIRLEELQAMRRIGVGESDCPRLTAGCRMVLEGHPRGELNGEYRIVGVRHRGRQPQELDQDADEDNDYVNEFTVTELRVPYRPARTTPRPRVHGMQTATVVGPDGEEIHTDVHGRVRVQFHWDRSDRYDENSATWLRVSQLWAGNRYGAMFLPRIGHEVLVDFLEGDPDRPIVVGRIYHGNNETPYPLPDQKTRSTIKSDSSLGGGGYNELRFEDRKDSEQVFLHAERNLDVRVNNDAFTSVHRHSHVTVGHVDGGKSGDSRVELFHDHHLRIHRHTQAHLGGDVALLIGGIDGSGRLDIHVKSDRLERVDGDQHAHIGKNVSEKIDGSASRIVEGDDQASVGGRWAVDTGGEIHLRAPTVVLDAGDALTIRGPGGHITINASGIYLSGAMIYLNSGGTPAAAADAEPATAQDAVDAAPAAPIPAERGSR